MRRPLSLRQVEAFKAVIEHGTISRAATVLNVSQPTMSKMIANLESDADLVLFDRLKGRLAPTQQGMRLYDEIDRIFTGVQQIETAIDAIQREGQGRIAVGVMPALSGTFIQKVATNLVQRQPQAFCVIEVQSSQRIIEWLVTHKLDVGLVSSDFDNPYLVSEDLMDLPLVCIMPAGHALAAKPVVQLADLEGLPFVSFAPENLIGQRVAEMIAEHGARLNVVMVVSGSMTLCELVAAGHGISLVHPLSVEGFGERIVVRPFEPGITFGFQVCRTRDSRSARLVEHFIEVARETARSLSIKG